MYLPIENVGLHMTRDAYRKVLQFAMECDKERYTKKINKTIWAPYIILIG